MPEYIPLHDCKRKQSVSPNNLTVGSGWTIKSTFKFDFLVWPASHACIQVIPWGQIPMNSATQQQTSQEIELKLTLPYSDRDAVIRMLRKSASLARRKTVHQDLLNVYYDTPEQDLRKRRIALRIRQIGADSEPVWVQTLKTGGASGSALSLRGEWETALKNNRLSLESLKSTPWSEIDPDGTLYQALTPCFITRFERTSWLIRANDHSLVEVAFDIGQIESGDQCTPICELELELKSGASSSLFDLALGISANVAVVPASFSKAERGYALAQGTLGMPQRSRPPHLLADQTLVEAAQQVFRETFFHFTRNLDILLLTDNAEVVHQARVGWRRFKSALRLFKPVMDQERLPDVASMQLLLDSLGQMRDLDVALTETLPLIAPSYTSDELNRQLRWNKFVQSLTHAAQIQRIAIRDAIRSPVVGSTLLCITRYIEEMSPIDAVVPDSKARRLESWTAHRLQNINHKLDEAVESAVDKAAQHRARIVAKRLRYGIESMQAVIPNRIAKRWLKKAATLQGSIGYSRDVQRLCQLAAEFGADAGLVEFLRGYGSSIVHRSDF
jgi:inorganic triphosphatase YgiF